MKSLVAVHGSYFGDNFGDTLFVEMFVAWIKDIEGYDDENITLPFASNRVRNLVKVSEVKGIKALIKSRCIVFIGGGYFGEPKPRKHIWHARLIVRHLSIALFAMLAHKPYIFIGIGAGPLTNKVTRYLVTLVCNHSEKVVVRDTESRKYLLEYGVNPTKVIETVDSVLALGMKEKKQFKSEIKIGVHLPLLEENSAIRTIISDLRNFCDSLDINFHLYSFKDFYKEGYINVTDKLLIDEFGMDKITTFDYTSPNQLIEQIQQFDIIITNKLHCGIVSLTQGVYTLSIANHPKTQRLYDQLGLSEFTIPVEEYKKGMLNQRLSNWNARKQTISQEIIDKAIMNKGILIEFMEKYALLQ